MNEDVIPNIIQTKEEEAQTQTNEEESESEDLAVEESDSDDCLMIDDPQLPSTTEKRLLDDKENEMESKKPKSS